MNFTFFVSLASVKTCVVGSRVTSPRIRFNAFFALCLYIYFHIFPWVHLFSNVSPQWFYLGVRYLIWLLYCICYFS
jgi:hypothetical protein